MPKQKIFNKEIRMIDDEKYVKYSVEEYRKYIHKIIDRLENIEPEIIRELCYFSIIESIAQDINNYPIRKLQDVFTEFVLKYQNKYNFLGLLDPVTLFYRKEKELSKYANLDDIQDGGVYFPEDKIIRQIAKQLKCVVMEKLNYKKDNAEKLLKEHRYVDLLYRLRCRMSHEFYQLGTSKSQFHTEPYYMNCFRMYVKDEQIVSDNVWTVHIPVIFLRNLCVNCIDNYLDECIKNNTLPIKNNNLNRICELSWYNRS